MEFTLNFFDYIVKGVFPYLGEMFGWFQALGELPLVYMNSLLRGDNVTWEIYNIFTQNTQIITLYSYGSIADWLRNLPSDLFVFDLLATLVDFVLNVFEPIGDVIFTVMFDYGTLTWNIPLWVGLVVCVPRFIVMFFMFKWFIGLFGVRI